MSRCIPFPPPGYLWNGVGGEALIELIKHNRERVEAEKERKKEKRNRKKERRRKKEKKKRREDGEVRQESQSHNCRHKDDRNRSSWEKSDNKKKRQYEAQGLENSSLTEELEQPMISDSQYDSSENSQNIKRKKPRWSPNGCNNHGSIIQFDFQMQKYKDRAALSGKPICSTPTQMDIVVQEKFEMAPRLKEDQFCSTSGMSINISQEMASKPSKEICHSPSRTEVVADGKSETAPASSLSESDSLQIESQFRELIVNWVPVPPPLQTEQTEFDDLEWLFNKRLPGSDMTQKTNAINISQEMASKPSKEICHSPTRTEVVADGKSETAPESSLSESGSLQIESQFRELIVNWVPIPLPLQTEHTEFDDLEWLFNKRLPGSDMTRKTNASNDDFCCGSYPLYPYACYLPKADIYAFPFTVPF